jgi:ABC-type branched-subunit amino acid transport system permease subunit
VQRLSFGDAAFWGLGGYALAMVSLANEAGSISWSLAALVVAAVISLVVDWFLIRTRSIYFMMITLAFPQVLLFGAVLIGRRSSSSHHTPAHILRARDQCHSNQ